MEQANPITGQLKMVIISDRFVPAFLAQTESFYLLGKECGYQTKRFLHGDYSRFVTDDKDILWEEGQLYSYQADIAIFTNVSFSIPKLAQKLRKEGCKSCYVLHEPYPGVREMRKEGKTFMRAMLRTLLDAYICKKVDRVLMPSEKSLGCYRHYYRRGNQSSMFPVMFPDKPILEESNRTYFSFVGSFSSSHNAEGFIAFMHYAYEQKLDITFRICTRTDISGYLQDSVLRELIEQHKLVINHGEVLCDASINEVYRQSICVWTIYTKSMQSGVLGQAYMMGTPVIASHAGNFDEVVLPGATGELVDDMNDMEEIWMAYRKILDNLKTMEVQIRDFYLQTFYYMSKRELMMQLTRQLIHKKDIDRSGE